MKHYYETTNGCVGPGDLKHMRIQQIRVRRPGKQVPDTTIVELAKTVLAGSTIQVVSTNLGISRRTASRWLKRLGFITKRGEGSRWWILGPSRS